MRRKVESEKHGKAATGKQQSFGGEPGLEKGKRGSRTKQGGRRQ